MNNIPNEILDSIIGEIKQRRADVQLAPYASVSRQWQLNIEKRIFASFSLEAPTQLEAFGDLFTRSNIRRWHLVRNIAVSFLLPSPSEPGCCDVTRIPNREDDRDSFSTSVRRLFRLLADVEGRVFPRPAIRLGFWQAYREIASRQPYSSSKRGPCRANGERHDLEEVQVSRARFGMFELDDPENLCEVRSVNEFYFQDHRELEDLRLSSVAHILRWLPNVKSVEVTTRDRYEWGRTKREIRRHYLSEAIRTLPRSHLKNLHIRIAHSSMDNESNQVHKFVNQGSDYTEIWYNIFKELSTFPALELLHIKGGIVCTPGLLRGITDARTPGFTSLRELVIEFSTETADGRWYFERDNSSFAEARRHPNLVQFWRSHNFDMQQEEADPDSGALVYEEGPVFTDLVHRDNFRTVPNSETLRPLLLGAAETVTRLANLQTLSLRLDPTKTHLSRYGVLDYPFLLRVFELPYVKSGIPNFGKGTGRENLSDHYNENEGSVTWRIGALDPWDDILAAWKRAVGPDTSMIFIKDVMEPTTLSVRTKIHKRVQKASFDVPSLT